MTLKVSVVIPTYARPKYLMRAIESVLNQSYSNIELIVVSDNDKDSEAEFETRQLISDIPNNLNVKYLPGDKNEGGCFARNRGLASCTGDYVNFLDDDDILLPQKIEKQVQLIESKHDPVAVVGCCAAIRNANGKIYRYETPIYDDKDIFKSELLHNICTTSLNLVNTEICKKAGGFEYIESSQEHLFLIKIFNELPSFCFVDEVLAEIDQHDGPRVSTNPKRPLGALHLTRIIHERYLPLLTVVQRNEVTDNRAVVDIKAYFELGERIKPVKLWTVFFVKHPFSMENLRVLKTMLKSLW